MSPVSPTVSVILPAYNSASFIQTTLNSILAQEYSDFEIIVIDDGSIDETAQIVTRQQSNRVRLISQKNRGISEARNAGLRCARGDYIAFIDHDDFWHPLKLSAQVDLLAKSDETVGICYGEFVKWNGVTTPAFANSTIDIEKIDTELSGWIYHQLLLTNWVLFSTALFKKSVFDAIGLFDREMPPADDWDIALRASRQFKFLKLGDVVALYRQHDQQTSRKCFAKDHQTNLRESMILRYGFAGPDGSLVDKEKLKDRRLRSHASFCEMHAAAGSILISCGALLRAIRLSPTAGRSWRCMFIVLRSFLVRLNPFRTQCDF